MPTHPPKSAFSNDDLVELEWVFASVCEALEANQERQDEEAKACIRRRLFLLACNNGISDSASLRDDLVRSFARSNRRRVHAAC
jgi:hypothetical protein